MNADMSDYDENAVATRGDLTALEKKLDGRMDKFDCRMDKLDGRMDKLDGRMGKTDGVLNRLVTMCSQLVGEIHEMRIEMREKFATKSEVRLLRSQMDGFAGQLGDFRRQWFYQSDGLMRHEGRLDDHERRLISIEKQRQS